MSTLSPNFTLYELTRSSTAARMGLDNTPPEWVIDNLQWYANNILEPVRSIVGGPIWVESGYRGPVLNKIAHGSPSSDHLSGTAADIHADRLGTLGLARMLVEARQVGPGLREAPHPIWASIDQLIVEYAVNGKPDSGWVHLSGRKQHARGQVLHTFDGVRYLPGLPS